MAGSDDDRWRHATLDVEDKQTVPDTPTRERPAPVANGPFDPPRRDRFGELGEIGRGGMGRVFEARDRALDRPVAIKQSLTDDAIDLARFEREARITAQLATARESWSFAGCGGIALR